MGKKAYPRAEAPDLLLLERPKAEALGYLESQATARAPRRLKRVLKKSSDCRRGDKVQEQRQGNRRSFDCVIRKVLRVTSLRMTRLLRNERRTDDSNSKRQKQIPTG